MNDSAVGDDKCTVGDKHHTFRAQTQNEQEMYTKQLNGAISELNVLQTIPLKKSYEMIELGAIANTQNGMYIISIGLGVMEINGKKIMATSPVSPIGNALLKKKKGEHAVFRGKNILIKDII